MLSSAQFKNYSDFTSAFWMGSKNGNQEGEDICYVEQQTAAPFGSGYETILAENINLLQAGASLLSSTKNGAPFPSKLVSPDNLFLRGETPHIMRPFRGFPLTTSPTPLSLARPPVVGKSSQSSLIRDD